MARDCVAAWLAPDGPGLARRWDRCAADGEGSVSGTVLVPYLYEQYPNMSLSLFVRFRFTQ